MSMVRKCPVCLSPSYKEIFDVTKPRVHVELGLPGIIRQCSSCGMVYKDFDKLLQEVYGSEYGEHGEDLDMYVSGAGAVTLFEHILRNATAFQHTGEPRPRILDIGCNDGFLMEIAQNLGFEAEGVERCLKPAESARTKGLTVHVGDIEALDIGDTYDVITMLDVIEHLEEPHRLLMRLKGLLRPDGELIIYTPNHNAPIVKTSALLSRIGIRSPMENIFACTHTCFFDIDSLRALLEKTGYATRRVECFPFDIRRPGQNMSVIEKAGIWLIENVGCLFGGKGFRMLFYAHAAK